MFLCELKVLDVHQAIDGKVQRLQYLEQAAKIATKCLIKNIFSELFSILRSPVTHCAKFTVGIVLI